MSYEGGCHCGAVRFTVDADLPGEAVSCNCSHCRAKGLLLDFQPAAAVRITAGEPTLETYRFNTHRLAHRFCATCGTQPLAQGTAPDGSSMCAVNLRCVPDADLASLTLIPFDGAAR